MLACDCHLILIKLPWTSITVKYSSSHHNTHPSECRKTDLQPTVCLFAYATSSSLLCFSSCMSHSFPLSETSCYVFCSPRSVSGWEAAVACLHCRDLVSIITCAQLPCADSEKAEREETELATGCYRKSASLICFCLWPEMMTCSVPLCLS